MLQKGTVVLVAGLGGDPQEDMSKCAGLTCRVVVPGTNHHTVVFCQPSSLKLYLGQRLVDSHKRTAMPMGCMPSSCGYTWLGYKHWVAQASGAASVVMMVV